MDYNTEAELLKRSYEYSKFTIEDINYNRLMRGENSLNNTQLIVLISILKKNIPLK